MSAYAKVNFYYVHHVDMLFCIPMWQGRAAFGIISLSVRGPHEIATMAAVGPRAAGCRPLAYTLQQQRNGAGHKEYAYQPASRPASRPASQPADQPTNYLPNQLFNKPTISRAFYAKLKLVMYSCTHVLMYSCTHVLMYSCTHVLMYSCTHVLMPHLYQ